MFHTYMPFGVQEFSPLDWDNVFAKAHENAATVWMHDDGSVAIASYEGIADYCDRHGIDGEGWTEIERKDC